MKGYEVIKTYTDGVRHTVTVGQAYRCIKCGVIWTRRKDILSHIESCKGKQL